MDWGAVGKGLWIAASIGVGIWNPLLGGAMGMAMAKDEGEVGCAGFGMGVGQIAKAASLARIANAEIQGLYGAVSRGALNAAANSEGPTITVFTKLSQAPTAGRPLSVAYGEGAEALVATARGGGQVYTATIPRALVETMKPAGLVLESTTSMAGAQARELRFMAPATEFVVNFFK